MEMQVGEIAIANPVMIELPKSLVSPIHGALFCPPADYEFLKIIQ
jgi:hypothetical protein